MDREAKLAYGLYWLAFVAFLVGMVFDVTGLAVAGCAWMFITVGVLLYVRLLEGAHDDANGR